MKNLWTVIGILATVALTACTVDSSDDQGPPALELNDNADEAANVKIGAKMKSECMVNDDGTEGICCNESDCWYFDPRDPYSTR